MCHRRGAQRNARTSSTGEVRDHLSCPVQLVSRLGPRAGSGMGGAAPERTTGAFAGLGSGRAGVCGTVGLLCACVHAHALPGVVHEVAK